MTDNVTTIADAIERRLTAIRATTEDACDRAYGLLFDAVAALVEEMAAQDVTLGHPVRTSAEYVHEIFSDVDLQRQVVRLLEEPESGLPDPS